MTYIGISELLKSEIKKPTQLDYMEFTYKNINFKVYGVLHGLTGGTNQEYRDLVNHTIAQSRGLKLGEKSMLKIYKGLDAEVDDWLEVPIKDVFKMTFGLCASPIKIYEIIKTIYKEKSQKKDRFGHSDVRRLQDMGGSSLFHKLDPFERRALLGFPDTQSYILENIRRRQGRGKIGKFVMSDPDWSWLNHVEIFANIPLRSIHMIEYAAHMAKDKKEVSLFVGETHQTDIAWYVMQKDLHPLIKKESERIKSRVNISSSDKIKQKYKYLLTACAGAAIPIWSYMLLFLYLMKF